MALRHRAMRQDDPDRPAEIATTRPALREELDEPAARGQGAGSALSQKRSCATLMLPLASK